MEEGKKKTIMIIVIIACLALAITITLVTRQGSGGMKNGKLWFKCNNPDCGAEYQLSQKQYMKAMANNGPLSPMMMSVPALVCPECGEKSAYLATKCSNKECGIVFIQNFNTQDYPDRCPECDVSETEERRNERKNED